MRNLLVGSVVLIGAICSAIPLSLNGELRGAVKVEGIMSHLEQLEKAAFLNDLGSRSVRDNYNASAEYIISQLSPYCQPWKQHFVVPVHEELQKPTLSMASPYTSSFQYGVDFQGMRYGGSGLHNLTARVTLVKGGCSASDFSSFPRNHIALIQEGGGCELVEAAFLAEEFGASGIFFFNQQTRTSLLTSRVRIVDWKEGDPLVKKPVLALSNTLGKLLANTPDVSVSLYTNMLLTLDHTFNVFCESSTGSKANIVMAGAHLDSVPEGPGLNDNGSGSSTLLEIALQFFRLGISNKNAVRFAWWGAEEIGLLGSRHYVRDLQENDPQGLKNIALYINFDMLAGPNYIPYIHDGYQVGPTIPEDVKAASRKVQLLFEDYFQDEDLPYQLNSMLGGSDFLPFIEAFVPTTGLATGASGIKTANERTEFGGLANAAYDPCYHLSCDTLLNINKEGLRQCAESSAQVIEELSTLDDLRGFLGSS